MSWLVDNVSAIREAAIHNFCKLVEAFGVEWAKETLCPQIQILTRDPKYLTRIACIHAYSSMKDFLGPELMADISEQIVIPLSKDPIPNVRFNVAIFIQNVYPLLLGKPTLLREKIQPVIESLVTDPDRDVRNFAEITQKAFQ